VAVQGLGWAFQRSSATAIREDGIQFREGYIPIVRKKQVGALSASRKDKCEKEELNYGFSTRITNRSRSLDQPKIDPCGQFGVVKVEKYCHV
jgi:hypothetical protein